MHNATHQRHPLVDLPVYDVVGIGFGPSNLALAVSIEEESEEIWGRPLRCLFLERSHEFSWHPGLLLGGARVQLSFLKDLATLRNPRSHFTFLNYLKLQKRLDRFVNLRNLFPTRLEFNDYYRWAASHFSDSVRYGEEVLSVGPAPADHDGRIGLLHVRARDGASGGDETGYLARNVVLATGGLPYLPSGVGNPASRRTFHARDLLPRLSAHYPDRDGAYRFVVVGSGQTAAEVFLHLLQRYPRADVTAAVRRFAYKPADESHFVNEIFFPESVELFFGLSADQRRELFAAHADTNYSAVDRELIEQIYEELYQQQVAGEPRARIRRFLELRSLVDHGPRVVAHFQDLVRGRPTVLEADAAILATGYQRPARPPLLDDLADFLDFEGDGFALDRNYRVQTSNVLSAGVFLQGFCEATHGLSDTLLSNLATRSTEILGALCLDRSDVTGMVRPEQVDTRLMRLDGSP